MDIDKNEEVSNPYKDEMAPLFLTELPKDIESNVGLAALNEILAEDCRDSENAFAHWKTIGDDYLKLGTRNGLELALDAYERLNGIEHISAEKMAKLHSNKSLAYYKLGKLNEAINEALTAIKFNTNDVKPRYHLIRSYIQFHLFGKAKEVAKEALATFPTDKALEELLKTASAAEAKRQQKRSEQKTIEMKVKEEVISKFKSYGCDYFFDSSYDSPVPAATIRDGKLNFGALLLWDDQNLACGLSDLTIDKPLDELIINVYNAFLSQYPHLENTLNNVSYYIEIKDGSTVLIDTTKDFLWLLNRVGEIRKYIIIHTM